jgi:glyceraldehyde-3-phosphate dehydrogenase (NADP+)
MNAIPEEFQIKTLLNQDTYLVNGELKNGWSNISSFSTILNLKETDQHIGFY